MILRVLSLIALIGMVGGDARADDERVGGEGFGNVVMLAVIVGTVVVVAVIAVAILALGGQFKNDLLDPIT